MTCYKIQVESLELRNIGRVRTTRSASNIKEKLTTGPTCGFIGTSGSYNAEALAPIQVLELPVSTSNEYFCEDDPVVT